MTYHRQKQEMTYHRQKQKATHHHQELKAKILKKSNQLKTQQQKLILLHVKVLKSLEQLITLQTLETA